jgi:hypothetical protein
MPLGANADQPKAPYSFKFALLCLKTGEQTSGLNKILGFVSYATYVHQWSELSALRHLGSRPVG